MIATIRYKDITRGCDAKACGFAKHAFTDLFHKNTHFIEKLNIQILEIGYNEIIFSIGAKASWTLELTSIGSFLAKDSKVLTILVESLNATIIRIRDNNMVAIGDSYVTW